MRTRADHLGALLFVLLIAGVGSSEIRAGSAEPAEQRPAAMPEVKPPPSAPKEDPAKPLVPMPDERPTAPTGPTHATTPAAIIPPATVAATRAPVTMPDRSQTHLRISDLRRVKPGTGDVSPLDAKLDVRDNDLRIPNNFGGVYQIPADAPTQYAGWFVRISGGVWAVFPQSTYRRTKKGVTETVPPGTQYFVGGIPIDPMRVAARVGVGGGGPERQDEREDSAVVSIPMEGSLPLILRAESNMVADDAGPDVNAVVVSGGDLESSRAAWSQGTERWISDTGYRSRRLSELLGKTLHPKGFSGGAKPE